MSASLDTVRLSTLRAEIDQLLHRLDLAILTADPVQARDTVERLGSLAHQTKITTRT